MTRMKTSDNNIDRLSTVDAGGWTAAASSALPAEAGGLATISLAIGVSGASVSRVEQADNPLLGDVHTGFDRGFGDVIEAKGEADPANAVKALDVTARYGNRVEFVGRA